MRLTFCCCVLLSWRYGDWKSATGKVKPRNLIIITILILIKWSFDLQMWSHSECLLHKHFVVQKSEDKMCFDLISLINDDNYAIVIHEICCWMMWCPKWYHSQHFLKIAANLPPNWYHGRWWWPGQATLATIFHRLATSIVNSKSTEVEEGEEL